MRDQALIQQFVAILEQPPPCGRQKEQVVQDFLEQHSELIPTPNRLNHHLHFQSIISKFPLSTSLITDYTYLTKSSDTWRVTFVELESPDKEIYNKTTRKVAKSAAFNASVDQVRSWKQFLSTNEAEVRDRLQALLKPLSMRINPIQYQFQLIIGRSTNKNLTDDRKREFRALQEDHGITIMTYDQLISWYENDLVFKKNVLRVSGSGYEFKSMEAGPNHMLSFLRPGELYLSSDEVSNLNSQGYDMEAWQRGELLILNGRFTGDKSGTLLKSMLSESRDVATIHSSGPPSADAEFKR